MRRLLKQLLLPPLDFLLVAFAGLLLWRRKPVLARTLLVVAGLGLWLLSTPLLATALLRSLQNEPALELEGPFGDARAIVVLSADVDREAPEFGGPTPGAWGLQRLRYGAALQRATGLPLLVTGGVPTPGSPPQGQLMRALLEKELSVPVRWVENRSQDTWENARFSAELLARDGIEHVLLVTHAWHMPRSRRAFEAAGLEVTAAPTAFRAATEDIIAGLIPRWSAMRDSALALHEYFGLVYYAIAYG